LTAPRHRGRSPRRLLSRSSAEGSQLQDSTKGEHPTSTAGDPTGTLRRPMSTLDLVTDTKEIESPGTTFAQVLDAAARLPGVRVDRAAYLRLALSRYCSEEQL